MAARWTSLQAAPTLHAGRLILRQFREDDLDAHAALLADQAVMRYIGGQPLSREDAWRRLLGGVGLWALQGIGLWAVERRSDQRLVGHVGMFDFHRDLDPSIVGEPEVGWLFASEVHGQGIAAEACRAALAWADAELDALSIPAMISPENLPSVRLAERLGFRHAAAALYKGAPVALYRRPRGG